MLVLNVIEGPRRRVLELPDRPFMVGSDPVCDLVLTGLDRKHLAIKPAGDGAWLLKVLGQGEVHVGGRATREAMLHQGARIELGGTVLEVMQAEHAGERAIRRVPRWRRGRSRVPWGWIGLGLLLLGAYVGHRIYGKSVAESLEAELARRRHATAEVEQLFKPYWDRREELSMGLLTDVLKRMEREAQGDPNLVRAIRLRRSTLAADLLEALGDPSAQRAQARRIDQEGRISVQEVLERVNGLAEEQRLEAALQLLEQAASEAGSPAAVKDLQTRKRAILADAHRKTLAVVSDAYRLTNVGRAQKALDLILETKQLYSSGGELDRFHQRLAQAELVVRPFVALESPRDRVASARPPPPASPRPEKPAPPVGGRIDWDEIAREREREKTPPGPTSPPGPGGAAGLVREAEEMASRWGFGAAARLYEQAADTYPGAAGLAALARARESFLLELAGAITADPGRFRNIRTEDGGRADFLAADATGADLLLDGVAVRMPWLELGVAKVVELGRLVKPEGLALLGMAAMALDGGLRSEFDQLLRAGLAREPALAGPAEPLLRRRTGKEGPYTWFQERWLPQAEADLLVRAQAAEKEARDFFGLKDLSDRSRALQELAARGDMERFAVGSALSGKLDSLAASIKGHPFFKQLDRVASLRRELDERRKHALDLIFDEETYFYPFRPPECPPEKAKLYWPVQQEVNRRVAAVQMVWNRKVSLQIPAALQALGREARWLLAALAEYDVLEGGHEEALLDVMLLPLRQGEVTVRNFAWNLQERERIDFSWRILRFNLVVEAEPTRLEMRQVEITNDYRMMMGRRALALHPKLLRSTRGHSEEMSRLGYFSHFSPVAANRTPVMRMNREGYGQGVSENIARGLGPDEAHNAWLHSSGHHRNILNPKHREFASGNHGDFWTQNYGRGADYEDDPLFETE